MIAAIVSVAAMGPPPSRKVVDISWPNCNSSPPLQADYGIVGINDGLDFTANPCLVKETGEFFKYALYINTGYPGRSYGQKFATFPLDCAKRTDSCLAYNYGYNATLNAVVYAANRGIASSVWWLDVETENSWTDNQMINRASLQGAVDALEQHNFLATIGFYAYPAQWQAITGGWRNDLPAWVATGSTNQSIAVAYCNQQNFTGGVTWLTQFTPKLDQDYTCNDHFVGRLGV